MCTSVAKGGKISGFHLAAYRTSFFCLPQFLASSGLIVKYSLLFEVLSKGLYTSRSLVVLSFYIRCFPVGLLSLNPHFFSALYGIGEWSICVVGFLREVAVCGMNVYHPHIIKFFKDYAKEETSDWIC